MGASFGGYVSAVKLLMDSGANPDLRDKDGWTALRWASKGNKPRVIQALLNRGASPDIQDSDGWTTLTAASLEGHLHVLVLLRVLPCFPHPPCFRSSGL